MYCLIDMAMASGFCSHEMLQRRDGPTPKVTESTPATAPKK